MIWEEVQARYEMTEKVAEAVKRRIAARLSTSEIFQGLAIVKASSPTGKLRLLRVVDWASQ